MGPGKPSGTVSRRTLLSAGATLGALQLASPFIIKARGEVPVKFGFIDPITGVYADVAKSEVEGARYAVEIINKNGGVLGRPVQLLVEDSANDVGTGVQKARQLIDRDKVDFLFGDVNSAIAYAIAGVAAEAKLAMIVPGGHTDPITGTDCKWNVFRICNTTAMDSSAIADTLMSKFGKKWFFLTPDYAYGHTLQAGFVKRLTAAGGKWQGALTPIGTPDYSAFLIKARAYEPDVFINIMGSGDQVNSLKQFVQFGMQKEMAIGGSLYELESLRAVPDAARVGWWTMEWWWQQPNVPEVAKFVADMRPRLGGKAPSARNWFGYVAISTAALAANQAKSLDSVKLAHTLQGFTLPPDIALQPNQITFRAGDHELMSNIFVGQAHPPQGDPDNMFTVETVVPGEKAEGSVEDTGCKLAFPA